MASETEIAWAAGLFEGEGTMWTGGTPDQRGSRTMLRLGMTDRDVVERLAIIVNGGRIRERPPGTGGHKAIWEWYLQRASEVVVVLEMLSPWFGIRRAEKARQVLKHARLIRPKNERTHCPSGHLYEGDNLRIERISRGERIYLARRCLTCRREQDRTRMRLVRTKAQEAA